MVNLNNIDPTLGRRTFDGGKGPQPFLWTSFMDELFTQKTFFVRLSVNPFIHSRYLYSTFSSLLLLRGAPHDYSIDTLQSTTGNCEWRTCQGLYGVARVGFEPATSRTQGTYHWATTPHKSYRVCVFQLVRPCRCKADCISLVRENSAGWEGSAILNHSSYIKIGCMEFVFSIVDQAPMCSDFPLPTSLRLNDHEGANSAGIWHSVYACVCLCLCVYDSGRWLIWYLGLVFMGWFDPMETMYIWCKVNIKHLLVETFSN